MKNLCLNVIAILLFHCLATSSFAQRTWHLEGDSVGTGDFIGTANTEDLIIKTDSITRVTIRSGGDAVFEGNIIDSTRVI